MSEKHVVVQGAICKCQFGIVPDKLKVNSNEKEYANDKEGNDKLIATTKELGATFENNSFGTCIKMGSPPPPCKPMVTGWTDYYEKVTLSNGGKIIVEDSKATCAIAGTPCISIIHHGQVAEPGKQSFKNANEAVHTQINPLVNVKDMTRKQADALGVTLSNS